jgi:hypothetical protein
MKLTRLATPLFALALLSSAASAFATGASQYGPPPGQGYGPPQQGGGWDAAPPEFRDYQLRGFQDGVQGARKDFENHRPPNVNNRDEFRNPGFIPRPFRHDYREGFKRGYSTGVRHLMGGPRPGGPPPGYGPR